MILETLKILGFFSSIPEVPFKKKKFFEKKSLKKKVYGIFDSHKSFLFVHLQFIQFIPCFSPKWASRMAY